MTLEELKAAMEEAEKKFKADAKNEELKKAFETAKAAYDAKLEEVDPEDNPDDPENSKWDDKTKAYIEKLRKENATHRTKNKELSSKSKDKDARIQAILKAAGIVEDEKPEEQIKSLSSAKDQLAFRNAVLESAMACGVAKDDVDYFEFLVSKAVAELPDDGELSEEQLEELAKKCKRGSGGKANSSAGTGKGKDDPNPNGGGDTVSLEKFCGMTIAEKSALYQKNPTQYEELVKAAKKAKKLV